MSLSVLDLLLTGLYIPFSPGSDDLHVGSESLDSQLKTNLIVALACAAVADSVSAFLDSDLSNPLSDYRTSEGSTEHISVLVDRACLNCGVNVILNELFLEVLDVELGSACLDSLFLKTVKLCALSYVAGNSDDLAVIVVFLEPRNDDRSIKTA